MKKRILSLLFVVCLVVGLMPATAFAETLENNPEGTTIDLIAAGDEMVNNLGTVATNQGHIINNHGTVITNEASIDANYGTVTNNSGTIGTNYGDVENNTGTVEYNYGGAVNGGTVANDFPHTIKIDLLQGEDNFIFSADSGNDDIGVAAGIAYAKEGASLTISPAEGFKFIGEVSSENGNLVENSDGSYTLEDITGDDVITLAHFRESEMVPAVDEAYKKLLEALQGSDFEALKTATDGFNEVLDIYNALTEEQFDELGNMYGKSGEEFWGEVLSTWVGTNIIFEVYHKQQDYIDDPNETTAKEFTDYYDLLLNDSEWAETLTLVRKFFPQVDEVYQQALSIIEPATTPSDESASAPQLDDVPKTGDNSITFLLIGILLIAAGLAACILAWRRKREN